MATGYVRAIDRRDGPVLYAKLKLDDGTQPQRKLGRLWTKRTRPPAGFLTRGQAEARVAAILAGDDPLVNITPSHVTFKAACDEQLRHLEHDKQSKQSYLRRTQHTMTRELIPRFANTSVEEITTNDVDQLRRELLERGLARGTVKFTLTVLNGVMVRAKKLGWITVNPSDLAERVTLRRSDEFNVLTVEQIHAVVRCAPTETLAGIFATAAFTGLRQGELIALRWRHVDFANRIVHVQRNLPAGADREDTPKSHRVRSVPLSDQAMIALDGLSRRAHFTGPDELVFGTVLGEHLSDHTIRDAFYDALEAAGLGHLRTKEHPLVFHDLRHTFGTQCAANGIDLPRIKAWMGHSNIETTMRYLHYVPQHDDAARITAAFGGRAPNLHRTADIPA